MGFFKCISLDLRILADLIDSEDITEEELQEQLQILIDELEDKEYDA